MKLPSERIMKPIPPRQNELLDTYYTPTEIEMLKLKSVFEFMSNDGSITISSLHSYLKNQLKFICSRAFVRNLLWEADDSSNETISLQSFILYYSRNIHFMKLLIKNKESLSKTRKHHPPPKKIQTEPNLLFICIQFGMFNDERKTGRISVDDTLSVLYAIYGRSELDGEIEKIFGSTDSSSCETEIDFDTFFRKMMMKKLLNS